MGAFVLLIAAMALVVAGVARSQATSTSSGQGYPSRPIRLIVASTPGGGPDIASREVANELTKQMGQQIIVENRPGANGIIGFEALKRATPDGYTFGHVSSPIATNPSVFAQLPYDWERDFRPVIFYTRSFSVLTVTPSLPVRSVKELIDHAHANPGAANECFLQA
jgi:tripartite-type tricarboxylate transporter receptor subunit TctC